MPDIAAIASAISSLKTAADITKGFLDLKEAAALQGKIIELQQAIMAAQSSALAAHSEQFSLQQELRDLTDRLAKLEGWEAERKRYKLVSNAGRFAYQLKPEQANGEPDHLLCATCFNQGRKSFLHHSHTHWYQCFICKDHQEFGASRPSSSWQTNDYDD